jgi:putative oxidoreductase
MKELFKTENSWTPLFLRAMLGLVVFAHGAQKLLGWFNGYGFKGTMAYFTETVGLSWVTGFAVILLESIGAILLIGGFSTRIVATAFTLLGLGILTTVHLQHGFFMNWGGNQSGEGIEFFLLWLAMSGSLIISGGGRYSVDQLFFKSN